MQLTKDTATHVLCPLSATTSCLLPTLPLYLGYPVYQMVARVGTNDVRHFPDIQIEARLLERPLHHAPTEEPQITVVLTRRAIRSLGGCGWDARINMR